MSEEFLNNCWACLLEAAEDLCSYFLDWTTPSKISGVNLFSLFQGISSEESEETTEKPVNSPLEALSNFFRFKRSSHRSRRSVAQDVPAKGVRVQGTANDVPVEKSEFLDLLNSFYVKMRERFMREHPGTLSRNSADLYRRPYEIADVAAYFLGVPRDRLVELYGRLTTKDIGKVLLKALDNRMAVLNGEQRTDDIKTFGSLSPTSISNFFKEFFASVNGIATGLSELFNIVIEHEVASTQPTVALK